MEDDDHRIGRRSDYKPELRDEVRRLYVDEGLTDYRVGKAMGLSRGRVSRIRRELGIPTRWGTKKYQERLDLLRFAANVWDIEKEDADLLELVKLHERQPDGARGPEERSPR